MDGSAVRLYSIPGLLPGLGPFSGFCSLGSLRGPLFCDRFFRRLTAEYDVIPIHCQRTLLRMGKGSGSLGAGSGSLVGTLGGSGLASMMISKVLL